ncbi:MAG: glycogen/starch/alpha-glucan phosphorylase [Oscillospiraceae bacterium]
MFINKEQFKVEYISTITEHFGKSIIHCGRLEKYVALVHLISSEAAKKHTVTHARHALDRKKEIYYFSMEFLIGRLLKNYLFNMGVLDAVGDGLNDLGEDLDSLCDCERDPGLGNGGLGRLAACFLDSMAFLDLDATGVGIRYRFGLFEQKIKSGWQTEEPDTWLDNGYPWETKRPDEAVTVCFGGTVTPTVTSDGKPAFERHDYTCVKAVPYDVPVVGYGGETVNTLRLWRAQPVMEGFDLAAFNRGEYSAAVRTRNDAEAISCILYPDDSTDVGRELRLKQEYFFVSAGLTWILRKYKNNYGTDEWDKLPGRVSVHINDTHPALCVPELMRLLMDEEGLDWDKAWDITTRTVSYTNHTVMPEALEKWPIGLFSRLLPRIYMIVEEIDHRYRSSLSGRSDKDTRIRATAILWDGRVRMANLSVIGSYSVNGVADLHTEILKTDTLRDFYELTPEKFNNKTNGVSHRRFLAESNPGLLKLLSDSVGERWIRDPMKLEELLKYRDDAPFLKALERVKLENKQRLADYIAKKTQIKIDPTSVFDIQVKRIHAYKRQLLNVFKIMDVYNRIKEDPSIELPPYTFIFAGKAAQSYIFAKEIIKLICSVADIVNADPAMEGRLKVVFLENFGVSLAQIIYPAADLSEQISTAGKEASGTGNMKFMYNGALTLGTEDGANVEIHELVGDDNIFIFGLSAGEAMSLYKDGSYFASKEISSNPRLKLITDQLVNGHFACCGWGFGGIYDALINRNDEYFVLKDFASYVNAWEHASKVYGDDKAWYSKSLVNIAKAGKFTSDRSIADYARDIWKA